MASVSSGAHRNGEPLNRAMSGARLRAERKTGGEGPAKQEPGGSTLPPTNLKPHVSSVVAHYPPS